LRQNKFASRRLKFSAGCRENYCSNHTVEHRADLRTCLEQVTNAYDSVQAIFQTLEQRLKENQARMLGEERNLCKVKIALTQIKARLMTRQKQDK